MNFLRLNNDRSGRQILNLGMQNLSGMQKINLSKKTNKQTFLIFVGFVSGNLIGLITTSSEAIGLAFGAICSGLPTVLMRIKVQKTKRELNELWPEILDHLISGITSGLSLAETISALSLRGPESTRPHFAAFEAILREGGSFESAISTLQRDFDGGVADQICEVLRFAKSSGSRDMAITLRTLSDFVRTDLALMGEITAKHGWVKNSAALAACAPWILLLILASQPNTVAAYSSSSGVVVLFAGVLLTMIAYVWMERVGQIRSVPRIFKPNQVAVGEG